MLKISDLNILNPLRIENCCQQNVIGGAHFDSRKCQKDYLYIALKGQNSDGHDFIKSALNNGAIAAVVDKDYSNKDNLPVIYTENVELFFAQAANLWRKKSSAKIIGITGTNGKTSTKEMLKKILSEKFVTLVTEGNFNNHLGVPLTLFGLKSETEIAVIEMGTNHFGEIKFLAEIAEPDLGIITNIGEGHLEDFGNCEGVLKEKIHLFKYLKEHNGLFFVNNEDILLSKYNYDQSKIIRFGLSGDIDFKFDRIKANKDGFGTFNIDSYEVVLGSLGITGCKNALAAMSVGFNLGLTIEEMTNSLQGFGAANKRGEIIQHDNAIIVIDCYNANPSSMKESIENILNDQPNHTLLVLGDMLEMGSASKKVHAELAEFINNYDFGKLLLFGQEMSECSKLLGENSKVEYFGTDFQALQNYFTKAVKNHTKVLLKGSRGMRLERLIENLGNGVQDE